MINKIAPKINAATKNIAKKSETITKNITHSTAQTIKRPQISAARIALEEQAERMTPKDYITARNYLASLEMDAMYRAETKLL